MNVYKLLSLLLEYPEQELLEHLDALRQVTATCDGVGENEVKAVEGFLDHLAAGELTALQADYVQTFDLTAEHSLHLTHHLFGDDKNRGPALIDLTEMYKEYGMELEVNELPDYLPLILEFTAQLDDSEARMFLGDAAKVLTVLAASLEKADSAYAPLLRIVEGRGGLTRLAA